MESEQTPETPSQPQTPAPQDILVKIDTLISAANAAAERLEKGNATLKDLITRQELMKIERTLGGRTDAGTPEKSKEEVAKESAKKLLEGTGYESILD